MFSSFFCSNALTSHVVVSFSLFFFVCMYVCMCMCVHGWMDGCLSMHMEDKVDLWWYSSGVMDLLKIFLRQDLSLVWGLPNRLGGLSSEAQGASCFHLLSTRITSKGHHV